MRLFLAAPLSEEIRSRLRPDVERLIGGSGGLLRPVPVGSEHLTLVFLGERDTAPEEIAVWLEPLRRRRSFAIGLSGARVFPARGRPRLVCLGVGEGAEPLKALAEGARNLLAERFADLEDYRVKSPHVTVARFGRAARPADGRRVTDLLERTGLAAWSGQGQVDAIELVRSELSPSGARYTTVASLPLP